MITFTYLSLLNFPHIFVKCLGFQGQATWIIIVGDNAQNHWELNAPESEQAKITRRSRKSSWRPESLRRPARCNCRLSSWVLVLAFRSSLGRASEFFSNHLVTTPEHWRQHWEKVCFGHILKFIARNQEIRGSIGKLLLSTKMWFTVHFNDVDFFFQEEWRSSY